jgi:hypothetical protein
MTDEATQAPAPEKRPRRSRRLSVMVAIPFDLIKERPFVATVKAARKSIESLEDGEYAIVCVREKHRKETTTTSVLKKL